MNDPIFFEKVGYSNRRQIPFRFSAIMLGIIVSFSVTVSSQVFAADDAESIAELKAENARLRARNEFLEKTANSSGVSENTTVATQSEAKPTADSEIKALGAVRVSGRHVAPIESLKDTPKSVSIVSGEELEKTDTNSFRNILTRIGNVSATYTNPQAGSLMIRGLGWASGAGPLDPSVGVTVDGISYGLSGLASSLNYGDLDTVQVNRGPQGTLGGKNSSVGEIIIKTRAPSFTPEANASITYGELNTINTKAAVGGPIIDNLLAWRGTFLREQADGEWENKNDQNYSYKNTDRTYGRVQFLLTPSDAFSALVRLDYSPVSKEISDNYVNFNRATPDFYDSLDSSGKRIPVTQSNEPLAKFSRRWFAQEGNYTPENYTKNEINRLSQNPNNYGSKGASATLTWDLAKHTLASITGYRDFDFDSGGGPISVFDIDRSPSTGHVEYKQYSQEFRISSTSAGAIDYQAGLYLFKSTMPERWTTARYGSDAGAYYATAAQYGRLDVDTNGQSLMLNSLDRLFTKTKDQIDVENAAIYGNIIWHITDPLTISTGLRLTYENRETSSERYIVDQGFGSELNPSFSNNVTLNGFNSNSAGVLTANSSAQLALANQLALKYFGATSYDLLDARQKQQVADAKAIRAARIGGLYAEVDAESFEKVLPTFNISPAYKINENQTAYVSWQHGEKAGVSQIIGATLNGGKSIPLKSEKSNTYELGLKSVLLNRTLVINTEVFLHDVKDYIQPVYFYDEAQTIANGDGKLAYTSGLGNVPKVQSKGLELDVAYSGIQFTTLRLAGAYNDARYKDFKFLAKPLELGGTSTPYYDASGKVLPGSAKYTFNLSGEYARPVFNNKLFHTNINYRYTTHYNNDLSLSRYAEVSSYGLADFSIGLGRQDKLFDASLVVKNLFDKDYGFLGNWNTYYPSMPRWIGVTLSSTLY